MWPGMRPATGWIAYVDLDAALLELARPARARRAGPARRPCRSPGTTTTWSRVGELDRDVGGVGGAHRLLARRRRPRRARRRRRRSRPRRCSRIERFIASAIRLVRIEPDAPTSMPATISAVLSSAMPAAAARQAGERVQQRDHDRHVGAADRQHEQVAEQRRGDQEHDEAGPRTRCRRRSPPRSRRATASSADVDELLARAAGSAGPGGSPGACRRRCSSPRTRPSR